MQTAWREGQKRQVFYSSTTFRILLDSMARPGKINQLHAPTFSSEPPHSYLRDGQVEAPINLYALGALMTLLDREVSFVLAMDGLWMERDAALAQWLMIQTGADMEQPGNASFALLSESAQVLSDLSEGTLLEPEASTTVFYCVQHLSSTAPSTSTEKGITLELRGPGIQESHELYVAGVSSHDIDCIDETRREYPLGIDLYLIDESGNCVGLPRTTRITNITKGAEHGLRRG